MKVSILGVSIDTVSCDDVRARVRSFLEGQGSHVIVTPNPEFLVAATTNAPFREFLNRADLSLPDGFGLLVAARILDVPLHHRVTGVEAIEIIAECAATLGKSVFLLGGSRLTVAFAADELRHRFPALNIVGAESGGRITHRSFLRYPGKYWEHNDDRLILQKIQRAAPDILLVALGHLKQELWIRDHFHFFPSVKIAMGVGGAFDYLAGSVVTPPRAVRALGLEWLWRLVTQPWRFKRIYTATIYFIYLVLKGRLMSSRPRSRDPV